MTPKPEAELSVAEALERLVVYTAMTDGQLAYNCERIVKAALSTEPASVPGDEERCEMIGWLDLQIGRLGGIGSLSDINKFNKYTRIRALLAVSPEPARAPVDVVEKARTALSFARDDSCGVVLKASALRALLAAVPVVEVK